jgi:cysteine synthase
LANSEEKNWGAHIRWTGPQLIQQLPELNIFSMAMGTAGESDDRWVCYLDHVIDATHRVYHGYKQLFEIEEALYQNFGVRPGTSFLHAGKYTNLSSQSVCNPVGDPIPGPRTLPLVEMCEFPWKTAVDSVKNIGSVESYRLSMLLSRENLICGPSSGMTLEGLFEFLSQAKAAGTLHEYAEPDTGEVSCVFVCCDLPYQYIDGYYERLEEADFPPIINEVRQSTQDA